MTIVRIHHLNISLPASVPNAYLLPLTPLTPNICDFLLIIGVKQENNQPNNAPFVRSTNEMIIIS